MGNKDKLSPKEIAEMQSKLKKHEAASKSTDDASDMAYGMIGMLIVGALIYWFFFSGPSETDEEMAARLALEKEVAEQEAAEAKEDRRKGFHCLSGWDGSHANFKRAVKDMMKDPDSFEHISTRVTPVSEAGMHTVSMEYRARNSFGGMNVGTAGGIYKNSDCSHTVVSVE